MNAGVGGPSVLLASTSASIPATSSGATAWAASTAGPIADGSGPLNAASRATWAAQ